MTAEPNLYVPPRDGAEWADLAPAAAGFDPERLQAAVDFAKAN